MAVTGGYLARRVSWQAQAFVRAYGQWVNEHIIPIAEDFDQRAEQIQEETYERLSARVNPETYSGDGSEFHESAFNAGLSFYETMSALHQATLNLFTAGLFHLIEQQLTDLTHDGAIEITVSDTKLSNVTQYYRDHFRVDLTQFGSWALIEEMRLVANATKHGEGGSAEELRRIRPELFRHPALRSEPQTVAHFRLELPLGGGGLYVRAEDFGRYQKAANELFDFIVEWFSANHAQYFPS